MATGTGILWHLNLKVNTPKRGLNMKFHMAEVTEATARTQAIALCARLKHLLPTDAEIFFATISKDDHKKDSRFVPEALGAGSHIVAGVSPPPSVYDFPTTSLMVRMEHADGSSVTRKIGPLPDDIVDDGEIILAVSNVTTVPVAAPAAWAGGDLWAATFNNFMKELMLFTHHVQSGHAPGGPYTYFAWTSMFALRIGQKKGGRVFI